MRNEIQPALDRLSALEVRVVAMRDGEARHEVIARIRQCKDLLGALDADSSPAAFNRVLYCLDRAESLFSVVFLSRRKSSFNPLPALGYVALARLFSVLVNVRGMLLGYKPMPYEAMSFGGLLIERIGSSRLVDVLRYMKLQRRHRIRSQ